MGCDCGVCTSSDPRDRRLRPSIFLTFDDGLRVLVDTTPDLRTQALQHDVRNVDCILFTHSHADHIMGLDDVRRYNWINRTPMPLYADERTGRDLRRTFAYVWDSDAPRGGGLPDLRLWTIVGPFSLGRQEVIPVPVRHGPWDILGFRFGRFAYLTDCNGIPDASLALLRDLDVVVLDALRHRPHPTHFTLDQAIEMSKAIGARQTYFTHVAHELGHEATCARLPAGLSLAYDGLRLELT
jgi:phosphoribosyl 1,2-cyclic phosphate phosphodiesterase